MRKASSFFGAAAAGTVASFSFGTGLAAWPAFFCLALILRTGWKFAAGLGAIGLLNAAIFFALPNDNKTEIGHGLSQLWSNSPRLFVRFLEILGAPWIHYGAGWLVSPHGGAAIFVAGVVGGCGLLLAAYFTIQYLSSRRILEPAETIGLGLLFFILGSMGLIVIGRAGLMITNPVDVLSPRYCFWSPFFWLALPVLALYSWPQLRLYPAGLCLLALAIAVGTLPSQFRIGAVYEHWRKATEDAALRLVCGTEDEATLQRLFRNARYSEKIIRPLASIYRERGLDMFAWPGARLVGQVLPPSTASQSDGPGSLGYWQVEQIVDTLRKDQPAARFSGWCLATQTHQTAKYVLISQTDGHVVGFGRFNVDEPKRNRRYRLSARHPPGFQGYIRDYSSKTRYECRAALDGKLVPQALRRIGFDSANTQ
jgi:hypothetical protein